MQDFQTTNSITYYYNVCLGYAIEACKATEAIEWEKGDAGGIQRHPMTSEEPNVIKTSLGLRSTEEILDANSFCTASFHLCTEIIKI